MKTEAKAVKKLAGRCWYSRLTPEPLGFRRMLGVDGHLSPTGRQDSGALLMISWTKVSKIQHPTFKYNSGVP